MVAEHMVEGGEFAELIDRLDQGDTEAAREIYDRFIHRLVALAKTRLSRRLSSKLDPDDVVMSVFRSFFRRQQDGQFHLGNWDGVWLLLAKMTVRKCARKAERFSMAKRDVTKESALTPMEIQELRDLGREPTIADALILEELLESLMKMLGPAHQPILALKLQGETNRDISHRLDISERSVYRVLDRVRKRLEDS